MFKTEPLYSSTPASGSSNKNLNNLLADDDEPQAEPPGLIQQILSFFSKLWSPSTSDAEKLGYSYVYAEDGSLLGEYGSGGSNSTGTAQYIYLPTASGPMPIAAVIKGQTYAVHSDHLNTPRKLTQPDGQVAWQWAYSAFGDEQPTIGAKRFTSETTTPTTGATSIPEVTFNLRYPGQYFDKETKLHYNYFRTYAPSTGRYTQGDPIGLDGGWNRFGYAEQNPLFFTDPNGLCPICVGIFAMAEVTMLLHSAAMDPVPLPGSSIAARSSVGAAMVGQAIPASVAKITPVVQAINHGIDTGVYCAAKGVGPTISRILPGSLPAAEEAAALSTLRHIDAGTKPTGDLAKKWGTQFKNWAGDLPGGQGTTSPYREYRVAPSAGTTGAGTNRIVVNGQTGEVYYTWTHYGDTAKPAFVQVR